MLPAWKSTVVHIRHKTNTETKPPINSISIKNILFFDIFFILLSSYDINCKFRVFYLIQFYALCFDKYIIIELFWTNENKKDAVVYNEHVCNSLLHC